MTIVPLKSNRRPSNSNRREFQKAIARRHNDRTVFGVRREINGDSAKRGAIAAMAAEDVTEHEKRVRAPSVDSPFFCAHEAAIYLRISLRALENFRATGHGPAYRKHGGRVVYHIHDLDLWSARRRFLSSAKRDEE